MSRAQATRELPNSAASGDLRVLTYNIHKGIGGIDRRYQIERILMVLRSARADILFLQEVDDGVPRSSRDRQVDIIGDALGFQYRAFQANVKLSTGTYGNAIVSRYPLSEVHDLDLSVRLKKRRRALLACCCVPHEPRQNVLLLNCHLGLAAYERKLQIDKLLRHLSAKESLGVDGIVAGGDFNDSWRAFGKSLMQPAGYATSQSQAATFPAALPVRKLDHICYAGRLDAVHSFVGHSELARRASDHLPLVVDFAFDEPDH